MAAATAVFACALYVAPAFADTSEPVAKRTVQVACYENGDYLTVDENGVHAGFDIDYLTEIGRYADWTYEYVDYPGWESAYAAMKSGEVDLLPLVYYTDERAREMLFSSSSLCDMYATLNVREDDSRYSYEDFDRFKGMRVGVIGGSQDAQAFVEYSAENGFETEIVPYDTTEALLAALDDGSIDGAAITHLGSNSRFRIVAQFDPSPLYIAAPLDRDELMKELDEATDRLKLRDPDFVTLLYDRYFGINTDQDPVFTEEENAYLSSAPVLRVAYDAHRAPLAFTDPETGEFAGVAAQLFDDIARITGLSFEFVATDLHEEALNLVADGEVDIACGVARNADKESDGLIATTGPYLRDPMALTMGSSAQGTRVALPKGFVRTEDLGKSIRDEDEVMYFDTPKECFDALLEGRADRAYTDTHVASYLLAEPQYSSLSSTTLTGFTNDLSLGVSGSADPRLANLLDRCVQYTSESKMTTWLSQSSLKAHPTSPVDFIRQYPMQIIGGIFVLFGGVAAIVIYLSRTKIRTARRIEELSFTDPLTGGWSLARFRTTVSDQLANAKDGDFALLYLDIKRFKSFNAAFGYSVGDELLQGLARTIGQTAQDDEHYAHITADEYVEVIRWQGWDDFLRRFDDLDHRFNNLPVLTELSHRLSLHAGVCVVERKSGTKRIDPQTVVELMDCARYARDSIEDTSRSAAALYTDDMKERDIAERALVALAHDALERGEFTAYYQPKVEIATDRVAGFEALARWNSPERGIVQPNDFIPLFEKSGLVKELDLQMFRQSCARIREHLDADGRAMLIACNFSRLHLLDDSFPDTLEAIVEEYGVPLDLLELELTENIVMEDLERAERVCRRLKDLGFRISIDDFGSGYSSLGTLQNLPIDVLKLDRSFLMSSESGDRCRAILDGVVGIADRLGVKVVVEGVETREQAAMLMRIDRRIVAQGFLYSRPVTREESDAQFAKGVLEPHERA